MNNRTLVIRTAITFLIIVFVTFTAYLINYDITTRKQFADVENEVTKVENDSIKPAGGVEYPYDNSGVSGLGDGLFSHLKSCYLSDVVCPNAQKKWYVPIMPSQEQDFIVATLAKEGYAVSNMGEIRCRLEQLGVCGMGGLKNGYSMYVEVADMGQLQPPTTNITPKVWRIVSLSVNYSPNRTK